MAAYQTLEMSRPMAPVVAPFPVTDDAGPMDRVPQSLPSEAPSQPKTRVRTKFDAQALSRLEVEFGMDQYPTAARRKDLASELAIPLIAVSNWFHNKRSRLRRQNRLASHPKSPHPIMMYRQMSSSSASSTSLSSPGFSPLVTPPPAKRFRSWSVEAVPSPEGVSLSDVDYRSSLDSSSVDSSSLGSSSLDSSPLSADSRSSYTRSTTTYTSHTSFSSGESLEGDYRPLMAGPSNVCPVVIFPEVFSPALVHPQTSLSPAVTPGALPCEDVFYHQDTPPSPGTPGEVFSPTLRIAQPVWNGDLNNNDQTYVPGLPPRGRLQAVSAVQDAGLVTLSRPRLDATSQPPTPLPAPRGQENYPPTPLPAPTGQENYPPTPLPAPTGQENYPSIHKATTISSVDYRPLDFQMPLPSLRLPGMSNLPLTELHQVPSISTPTSSGSPQTPMWLYCNSPLQPPSAHPYRRPDDQLVPKARITSPTTPDSLQDILALQWLSPLPGPTSSAWAWSSASSDDCFQYPEVSPGGYPGSGSPGQYAGSGSPGQYTGSVPGCSPYRDLDSDMDC